MNIQDPTFFYTKTIEELIDYLDNENISVDSLRKKLIHINCDKLIQKISFAEKRINEPLELSLKIFYILAPFGIINIFSQEDTNFNRFVKYRYIRKIKSFYVCSSIGVLCYTIRAFLAGFIYSKF